MYAILLLVAKRQRDYDTASKNFFIRGLNLERSTMNHACCALRNLKLMSLLVRLKIMSVVRVMAAMVA